jgi:hypothetical protein
MNDGARYKTFDLVLATYLIAGDVSKLIDIRSNGDGRKLFCFTPAPSKEQLIEFYSGLATVSAKKFAETFATLKGAGHTMREYA